ncbi:hypothetical protein IU500_21280 [Nocardia terpenica]|uniref:hypothetical protein n=1 Tax=Nocardia terpenica TaxID=455432 RepID=UPI001894BA66|nr:hypothetical protein [Nocardia terpenica]MBF6064238.1 hypothetical protein [Nocardia terpenica]MBF6106571.1 hypothetical protein [Nocardia terpenica]MBF6113856.1 hypothetical protein [Nocardia terpenica]MBF6120520.1 hypothetical protein [Nocardia terpenica]MBF6154823.1 hypothetical protein [Nocardia terpenica]
MKLLVAGVAAGIALLGSATAHAAPLTPDYTQQPNGEGADPAENITPAWTPVQVPAPAVTSTPTTTTIIAHPYLSPWVHALIPFPPNQVLDLRGAAQLTLPTTPRTLVVNPNGHCRFGAPHTNPTALQPTSLTPVRVDTPNFQLVIEPTLYR